MKINCEKCRKEFDTSSEDYWESGKIFEGIDRHHNPTEEIYRILKQEWNGEFYNLCRDCHQILHKEIILILKKYSMKPKYDSAHWLMKYMTPSKIISAMEEIYGFTNKWVNGDDANTNS